MFRIILLYFNTTDFSTEHNFFNHVMYFYSLSIIMVLISAGLYFKEQNIPLAVKINKQIKESN